MPHRRIARRLSRSLSRVGRVIRRRSRPARIALGRRLIGSQLRGKGGQLGLLASIVGPPLIKGVIGLIKKSRRKRKRGRRRRR